ncbi:nucleoside deaminase [Chrysiogenes arsenatis]|uniref:nucleoside deaminase n=1 Tax=Chrysiogenes arsenatis TaxID=309797 RepID=UPI001F2197C3|nr:nucleoside deaminase [Chrysiogenes arsenatis]
MTNKNAGSDAMNHQYFMKIAIELAQNNILQGRGGPFGAIVVQNGIIIGRGVNTVTSDCDPTAHAEIAAIRQACRSLGAFHLHECDLYTTCEPCPMCLGAIYWAHIRHIYYGATRKEASLARFDDEYIYREIPLTPDTRSIAATQIIDTEANTLFNLWNSLDEKVQY